MTGSTPARLAVVDGYSAGQYLLRAARERGLGAVHVRTTPAWLAAMRAPDLDAYDESLVVVDGEPTAAQRDLLRRWGIVAVLPGQESAVEGADRLRAALGLAGNDPSTSAVRRDKFLMNEALRERGVPAVRQWRGDNADLLVALFEEAATYPAVAKPLASAGTDGVYICVSADELRRAIVRILSRHDLFGRPNEAVLVQEYLHGEEYIVDTVSQAGRHHVVGIWRYAKRTIEGGHRIYDLDVLVPQSTPDARRRADYVRRALDAVGIQDGPAHAEVIDTPNGPRLVEVGARLSGNIHDTFHNTCLGDNQARLAVAAATGSTLPAHDDSFRQPAVVFHGASEVSGTVRAVRDDVVRRIRELPSLHDIVVKYGAGDRLAATVDLMTTSCKAFLTHPDEHVLARDLDALRELNASIYDLELETVAAGRPVGEE